MPQPRVIDGKVVKSGQKLSLDCPDDEPQAEACCLRDGTCVSATPIVCLAAGGVPQGKGTECINLNCPVPGCPDLLVGCPQCPGSYLMEISGVVWQATQNTFFRLNSAVVAISHPNPDFPDACVWGGQTGFFDPISISLDRFAGADASDPCHIIEHITSTFVISLASLSCGQFDIHWQATLGLLLNQSTVGVCFVRVSQDPSCPTDLGFRFCDPCVDPDDFCVPGLCLCTSPECFPLKPRLTIT